MGFLATSHVGEAIGPRKTKATTNALKRSPEPMQREDMIEEGPYRLTEIRLDFPAASSSGSACALRTREWLCSCKAAKVSNYGQVRLVEKGAFCIWKPNLRRPGRPGAPRSAKSEAADIGLENLPLGAASIQQETPYRAANLYFPCSCYVHGSCRTLGFFPRSNTSLRLGLISSEELKMFGDLNRCGLPLRKP